MRSSDLSRATWRKSSRSNDGGNGDCVEIAELPDRIALRDSKHPAAPVLELPPEQWHAFLSAVRANHFTSYEIDLNSDNAAALRKALAMTAQLREFGFIDSRTEIKRS